MVRTVYLMPHLENIREMRYGVVTCVVMCEVDSSLIQRLVQLMPRTVGVVQRRVRQLVHGYIK